MATVTIAPPNLQRFALPDINISRDNTDIISIIDDLVERVLYSHYRRHRMLAAQEEVEERELVA